MWVIQFMHNCQFFADQFHILCIQLAFLHNLESHCFVCLLGLPTVDPSERSRSTWSRNSVAVGSTRRVAHSTPLTREQPFNAAQKEKNKNQQPHQDFQFEK